LQEKQIDRESQPIAAGQTLAAVYGHGTPLKVSKIRETKTLSCETLRVSGACELRNGDAKSEYIGGVDEEASRLRHGRNDTSI
jgi:hypothetical protein